MNNGRQEPDVSLLSLERRYGAGVAHPDPRWIDGRRIGNESQGTYVRADGRVVEGIMFGTLGEEP